MKRLLWFDWTTAYVPVDDKGRAVDVEKLGWKEANRRAKEFVGFRLVNGKWVRV